MFNAMDLKELGIKTAYSYIEKNPEQNSLKLMDWIDHFAGKGPDSFEPHRRVIRQIVEDPESNWNQLIMRIIRDTNREVIKTVFTNFFLHSVLLGWKVQQENREKYQCNIPWTILLDPTSACNLHCTGCWAAEYGNQLNLSFDEIDDIITQGKALGIYMYIYTGGEPLVRKRDLIALCQKHHDCIFLTFTNGTLIDDTFAQDLLRVKNLIPAISVEGNRQSHDARRGAGSYDKVLHAMELLRHYRIPFGISCCYTSQNFTVISSEAFYDQMIQWGASFVWYFHYMPVGNDATPELLPTAEQRAYLYHQIRHFRQTKPIFGMDFQNDGEYVGGCIAGGRRYLHINANGDADPCVFIHYSNCNIRENSLLECLQSPLFMAYHDGQPFNQNHLRPCPMLENPEKLQQMVLASGAHSTDLQSPEAVEHLCGKCHSYAAQWQPTANRLWAASPAGKKNQHEPVDPYHIQIELWNCNHSDAPLEL